MQERLIVALELRLQPARADHGRLGTWELLRVLQRAMDMVRAELLIARGEDGSEMSVEVIVPIASATFLEI